MFYDENLFLILIISLNPSNYYTYDMPNGINQLCSRTISFYISNFVRSLEKLVLYLDNHLITAILNWRNIQKSILMNKIISHFIN